MGRNKESLVVSYTKAAEKFFKSNEDIREKYKEALYELFCGENPEKVDVKRIQGKKNDYYRIRIEGWRIIYTVINGRIVVVSTIMAGPRGDIYKKIKGLK